MKPLIFVLWLKGTHKWSTEKTPTWMAIFFSLQTKRIGHFNMVKQRMCRNRAESDINNKVCPSNSKISYVKFQAFFWGFVSEISPWHFDVFHSHFIDACDRRTIQFPFFFVVPIVFFFIHYKNRRKWEKAHESAW